MLKATVDEALLLESQIAASELRRERDGLKESNTLLAQRLSRVQDTLNRIRRDKAAMVAELTVANTHLFERVKSLTDELKEVAASRRNLAANVSTLESIVSEAMDEKTKRDGEYQQLLQKYSELQERNSRAHESAPQKLTEKEYDGDTRHQTAAAALRALHTIHTAVRQLGKELERQTSETARLWEKTLRRVQAHCTEVLSVDDQVIATLQSTILEKDALLSSREERLAVSEAALANAEKALSRAKSLLTEKNKRIGTLQKRLGESEAIVEECVNAERVGAVTAETARSHVEVLTAQLLKEQSARQAVQDKYDRQVQQSIELEQRFTAHLQQLERSLQEKYSSSQSRERQRAEEITRVEKALLDGLQSAAANAKDLARSVQRAVVDLQATITLRRQDSLALAKGASPVADGDDTGLSISPDTTSSSADSPTRAERICSPPPRPPSAF